MYSMHLRFDGFEQFSAHIAITLHQVCPAAGGRALVGFTQGLEFMLFEIFRI